MGNWENAVDFSSALQALPIAAQELFWHVCTEHDEHQKIQKDTKSIIATVYCSSTGTGTIDCRMLRIILYINITFGI